MKAEEREFIKLICSQKKGPGAVIPVLHEVQQHLGYLPVAAQKIIGDELGLPHVVVNGIVSFYSLFRENPKGKFVIGLCKGTACYVKGEERLADKIRDILGIEPGQTTPDGMFSLEIVRCLGSCGLGPVMSINEKVYTRVKAEKLGEVFRSYYDEQVLKPEPRQAVMQEGRG